MNYKMPAGLYYVGDLCYVLDYKDDNSNEWNEVCSLMIEGNNCLEGKFKLPDGREFISFNTTWGDGEYSCSNGASLGVDAGLIGCIKVQDIKAKHSSDEMERLGTIIHFPEKFICASLDGYMEFGDYVVDTTGDEP